MPGTLTSPYTDNANTPAPLATVGFKLSKPGYSAVTSAGQNMVFDSSWPSLPVAYDTGLINNTIASTFDTATIAHNLNFPPLVFGWAYFPDPGGLGNVTQRFICAADRTNIYLNGNSNSSPPLTATKIRLKAFQLDLSKDINYILAPGDTFKQPYDANYGVKVTKPNKDINSKDMRDFSVHSRCQSPLILAVKTEATMPTANIGTGIGNVIQYTSSLSYAVWVYGFIRIGGTLATNLSMTAGTYYPAPYYSQAYPRVFTDGFKAYIGYTASGPPSPDTGATLVILRDPMFAATQQAVTY
jgi:hypothetical protein